MKWALPMAWVAVPLLLGGELDWRVLLAESTRNYNAGQHQRALELAQQAVRCAEPYAHADARFARSLSQLGLVHAALGQYPDAETAYRRAIREFEGRQAKLQATLEEQLLFAQTLEGFAIVLLQNGRRYAQADRQLTRALSEAVAATSGNHALFSGILANAASVKMMMGKQKEADDLFRRALAAQELQPSQSRAERAGVLSNLGYLAYQRGDPAAAHSYMIRGLDLYEEELGTSHPELIKPLLNLAFVRLDLKLTREAEESARRATALIDRFFGMDSPASYEALAAYAHILRRTGRKSEAREWEAKAKSILEAHPFLEETSQTVSFSDLMRSKRRLND